jgi:hypothetical protein
MDNLAGLGWDFYYASVCFLDEFLLCSKERPDEHLLGTAEGGGAGC